MKTLGQIAHQAAKETNLVWNIPWEYLGDMGAAWEEVASAVAAAVKEEDARICGQFQDGGPFADMIRASIKEVK